MSYIVVDVESDGPIPNKYSMVCFGAVAVDKNLNQTFYGQTKPISETWDPEALAISRFSREQHLTFDDPKTVMQNFADWIQKTNTKGRPVFISDNPAYDWQFINYYFHYYLGHNPFGFSARRIGDLFCGVKKDLRFRWKQFRKTSHDHNPVNDALGNAEALLKLEDFGIKVL